MKENNLEKIPVLGSDKLDKIKKDIQEIGDFIVEETEDGLKVDFIKK